MADLPIGRRPVPMPQPRPGVSTNPGEEMMYGVGPEDQFMGMAPPDTMGAGGDQRQALIEMLLRMMEQQAQRSR